MASEIFSLQAHRPTPRLLMPSRARAWGLAHPGLINVFYSSPAKGNQDLVFKLRLINDHLEGPWYRVFGSWDSAPAHTRQMQSILFQTVSDNVGRLLPLSEPDPLTGEHPMELGMAEDWGLRSYLLNEYLPKSSLDPFERELVAHEWVDIILPQLEPMVEVFRRTAESKKFEGRILRDAVRSFRRVGQVEFAK